MRTFLFLLFMMAPAVLFAQDVCPELNAELLDFGTTIDEDPGCFQIASSGKWDGCESPVIQISHTCADEVTFEDIRDWSCDGSPCVEVFPTGTIAEYALPLPDDGITIDTSFAFWVGEDPVEITASYGRTREPADTSGGGDDGGGCATGHGTASPLLLLLMLALFSLRERRVSPG